MNLFERLMLSRVKFNDIEAISRSLTPLIMREQFKKGKKKTREKQ